jgi:tRNA A37 threonylcarbamoyladenosine biosynthesis protein TsaE
MLKEKGFKVEQRKIVLNHKLGGGKTEFIKDIQIMIRGLEA